MTLTLNEHATDQYAPKSHGHDLALYLHRIKKVNQLQTLDMSNAGSYKSWPGHYHQR